MGDLEYPWSYETSAPFLSYHPGSIMMVEMKPQDFLDLAAPVMEWSDEYNATMDWMVDRIRRRKPLGLPYLDIEDRRSIGGECVVTGHEGRHRMAAAKLQGIKTVPVIVKLSKKVKEPSFFDSSAWEYPKVDDQTCLMCDIEEDGEQVCQGEVRAEGGVYEGAAGVLTESFGPVYSLKFKRVDIDWCKVPDVKNATKNWLKEEGIELDCD